MSTIDFWQLLPSAQRIDDADRGYPLRTLLNIISQQANAVHQNIDDLWDDYFIETCDDWVVPYIGQLVGNIPLQPVPSGPRADVARTVYFRRRKGTVPMLEELAGFVTGWPAHTVAFFDRMTWTQHMNHLRPGTGTVDLRRLEALDALGTAFNDLSHSADIRPFSAGARYNIPAIGCFLWRLGAYQLRGATPRRSTAHPHGYHFSPLGNPAPLFNAAHDGGGAGRMTGAGVSGATPPAKRSEAEINGPIRHPSFHHHLTDYYPEQIGDKTPPGLSIFADGERIPPELIQCMNLSGWAAPAAAGIRVGIDIVRGRFAFAAGAEPSNAHTVRVNFGYGFSSDIGGGPYDRSHLLERTVVREHPTVLALHPNGIAASVQSWTPTENPAAVLELPDSRTFDEAAGVSFDSGGLRLTLQAANSQRPVIRGVLAVGANAPEHLVLDGLVIEGPLTIAGHSRLRRLSLIHCTLVPGWSLNEDGSAAFPDEASLMVGSGNGGLEIELINSITGRLQIPQSTGGLLARNCIIDHPGSSSGPVVSFALAGSGDGNQPGPSTSLERVTVFGRIQVRELTMVSESILTGEVVSRRRQHGCVRFSYLPDGSSVPGHYRCQPATGVAEMTEPAKRGRELKRLTPLFTSRRYGQPGYAQLAAGTAAEILAGGQNRAEMGVFNELFQPQREANLRTRLEEYLPFGLEPGFIYVT
ncbi:hypothetical protein [Arthrobacter antioxidans]|uniref:hypothetical protein n=1 Tax=Arthrobacter antioxidans TaxID=2895818 RepID=UPI001FFE69E6|nr:hypothetical protein [Arthrobacter antioxidans]